MRVWIERAGQAILGPGRLELLEAIDRDHSISAAAARVGLSYRRAWETVQRINEAAGVPLVTAATGGAQGGGTQLTPLGRWALAVFREVQEQILRTAATLHPRPPGGQEQATLHVAAAVSLEEVVSQLLTDFGSRFPAVRVRAIYGASDELADYLLAGAPGDIFLTADPHQLERLQVARLVDPDQVTLAENGLTVIAPASSDVALRGPADLASGTWRVALANPTCPLGGYTRTYLDSIDLYETLSRRAVWVENSRGVVNAVRAGQADAALVYSSDAVRAEGCRCLFRIRRLPAPIRYRGAVLRRSQGLVYAQELLRFLTSTQAVDRFRACGFLAAQDRA